MHHWLILFSGEGSKFLGLTGSNIIANYGMYYHKPIKNQLGPIKGSADFSWPNEWSQVIIGTLMHYLLASTSLTDTIFYRTNCSIGKHYALCFELNKFKPLVDIVQVVLCHLSQGVSVEMLNYQQVLRCSYY